MERPIELAKNGVAHLLADCDAALEAGEIDEAEWHRRVAAVITPAYLAAETPWGQSGKTGDAARWSKRTAVPWRPSLVSSRGRVMRRLTFATPKNHFVFKRIFGSDQHKDVLVAFLNAMLGLDEAHRIVRVELLSPEQRPAVAELELSIVGVKCTDARGVIYVVEMQVLQVEGFDKRIVENVAKVYANQIVQGDGYPDLNDVIGITICDFVLWPDTESRRLPMLTRWRMTEQQTGAKELGQIQLVVLELPKYDVSRPPQTVVEKWAYFFREADSLTMVPEVLTEPPFIDALDAARIARFMVGEWDAYIDAGIAVQNKRGALAAAERRGWERGLRQGREAGLRQSIEALCGVLGIELTDARRRELASLNTSALEALLARLGQHKSWT